MVLNEKADKIILLFIQRGKMDLSRRNFLKKVTGLMASLGVPSYWMRSASAASPVVKIGILNPFSGLLANIGRQGIQGAELAVEEINSRGGMSGARVEITAMDAPAGRPEQIHRAFLRFVHAEKVNAVIGSTVAGFDKNLSQLAEQYKMPLFVINPFRQTWFRQDLRFTFCIVPDVSLMARQAIDYLKQIARQRKTSVRTIALLRSPSSYWNEVRERIRSLAPSRRLSIVFDGEIPWDPRTIPPVVKEAQRLSPDLVFLLSTHTPGIKVTVQTMRKVKFNAKAVAGFFSMLGNAAYVASERNLFLNLMDANFWGNPKLDAVRRFQQHFLKRFKNYPSNSSYGSYSAIYMLRDAIKNTNSLEGNRFATYLREAELPSYLLAQRGPVKFDNNGQNINAETVLLQVSNPRPIPIYPKTYAGQDPVFPFRTT